MVGAAASGVSVGFCGAIPNEGPAGPVLSFFGPPKMNVGAGVVPNTGGAAVVVLVVLIVEGVVVTLDAGAVTVVVGAPKNGCLGTVVAAAVAGAGTGAGAFPKENVAEVVVPAAP